MKMIFILLDLPYLNHFDATASLPRDVFTPAPDTTPFYSAAAGHARSSIRTRPSSPSIAGSTGKLLAQTPRMDAPEDMVRPFADAEDDLAGVVRGTTRPRSR